MLISINKILPEILPGRWFLPDTPILSPPWPRVWLNIFALFLLTILPPLGKQGKIFSPQVLQSVSGKGNKISNKVNNAK